MHSCKSLGALPKQQVAVSQVTPADFLHFKAIAETGVLGPHKLSEPSSVEQPEQSQRSRG